MSVCVALVIQHATRMRRIILLLVVSRLYLIFPHYLIKGTIFGKKLFLDINCVFLFSLQLLLETFLILA